MRLLLRLGGREGLCVWGGRSADGIEAVFHQELVQGNARDAHAKGGVDEVEQGGAGGVRVLDEESIDGEAYVCLSPTKKVYCFVKPSPSG